MMMQTLHLVWINDGADDFKFLLYFLYDNLGLIFITFTFTVRLLGI